MDCRRIMECNPGCGGTSYMFFIISYLLSVRENGLDVTLFVSHEGIFPEGMAVRVVPDWRAAWATCDREGYEYLVIRSIYYCGADGGLFLSPHKTRLVVWCHNFASREELKLYSRSNSVARIITVGREQLDLYRDDEAFGKSDYIYNCVDTPDIKGLARGAGGPRRNVVAYVGAIIPGKGFHLLAKAWPKILEEVPDAELFVIGSGKLYDKKSKLGKWGLADERYESTFMKYLTRGESLLPGVHLLGTLGGEKYAVLAQTKVGVPNPSGHTETFCISAVEMQMMGARVVSKRCAGYLDTVRNGVLFRHARDLARCVVDELRKPSAHDGGTLDFIEGHFSQQVVVRQWEQLFLECLESGRDLHDKSEVVNPDFELKRYKEWLRRFKLRHPWACRALPPLDVFVDAYKRLALFVSKRVYKYF